MKLFIHFEYRLIFFNALFQCFFILQVFKLLLGDSGPITILNLALSKFKITSIFNFDLLLSFFDLFNLVLFMTNDVMYFLDEALAGSADPIFGVIILILLSSFVSIRLLFSLWFFMTCTNFFLLKCLLVRLMSILMRTLIFGLVLKCTGPLL